MAGVGATFNSPRVAGAEDDGFRARSTSAEPRSGTIQELGCRARMTLSCCLPAVSVEEIPFSYGSGPTRSGGIVVM